MPPVAAALRETIAECGAFLARNLSNGNCSGGFG
jgi:hypothetical protein